MRTESRMRLIYTAGPYSAPDRTGVVANIRKAEALALEVARVGAFPVCPHTSTAHPNFESLQPYQFWIDGTRELLRRCDGIIMVPGWEASKGACGELAEAQRLGLAVFMSIEELVERIGAKSRPFSDVPKPEPRDTEPAPPLPSESQQMRAVTDG